MNGIRSRKTNTTVFQIDTASHLYAGYNNRKYGRVILFDGYWLVRDWLHALHIEYWNYVHLNLILHIFLYVCRGYISSCFPIDSRSPQCAAYFCRLLLSGCFLFEKDFVFGFGVQSVFGRVYFSSCDQDVRICFLKYGWVDTVAMLSVWIIHCLGSGECMLAGATTIAWSDCTPVSQCTLPQLAFWNNDQFVHSSIRRMVRLDASHSILVWNTSKEARQLNILL